MTENGTEQPDKGKNDTANLAREVHWITHASFWLQIGLAVIGLAALWIYYNQLQQMIASTNAAQDAAYDACISAKIARQTLLEYQTGEGDSHSVASGTIAQASAVIQGESGYLATNATIGDSPDPAKWQSVNPMFTYGNAGKSSISHVRIKYTVQLLPHGTEPNLSNGTIYHDSVLAGVLSPYSGFSFAKANLIDKDGKFLDQKTVSVDDFRAGKVYVVSFGRAEYQDMFGTPHWQTFCGFFDYTVPDPTKREFMHPNCAKYNNQDFNLVYPLIRPETGNTPPSTTVEQITCIVPKH